MIYFFLLAYTKYAQSTGERGHTEHDLWQPTVYGSLWDELSGAETLKNGHSLTKYRWCSPCL